MEHNTIPRCHDCGEPLADVTCDQIMEQTTHLTITQDSVTYSDKDIVGLEKLKRYYHTPCGVLLNAAEIIWVEECRNQEAVRRIDAVLSDIAHDL